MKRKALSFLTAVVVLMSLIPAIPAAAATTDWGINTVYELIELRERVNNGEDFKGATITLHRDIDLGGSADALWAPIGTADTPFAGTFDGNGYNITGLYIDDTSEDAQGLFGVNSGTIENLAVEGAVTAATYTGGIVGINYGAVTGCNYTGTLDSSSGSAMLGGIAGYNFGTVADCCNAAAINGRYYVGGVAGSNDGAITGCSNTGDLTVNGSGYIGGITGFTITG